MRYKNEQMRNEVSSSRKNEKRTREDSSSEEGIIIIRLLEDKLVKQDNIQLCVSCNTALPKQFALARLFKDNKIEGITRVKYVHQYKF